MKISDFVYDEKVRRWALPVAWVAWIVRILLPDEWGFASSALFAFCILVPVVLFGSELFKDWRDKRRGYTMYLAEFSADGSLAYMEGKNILCLYFERDLATRRLTIHTFNDEAWPQQMPEWAKNRKAELMERIIKEFPRAHFEEHNDLNEVDSLQSKREDGTKKMEPGR